MGPEAPRISTCVDEGRQDGGSSHVRPGSPPKTRGAKRISYRDQHFELRSGSGGDQPGGVITMGINYTVILFSRQHFGDEEGSLFPNVQFVGQEKTYTFDCPEINPNETAILVYNSYDVTSPRDRFEINGKQLYGGLYEGPGGRTWASHELLVEPEFKLKASGNLLHVKSLTRGGHPAGDIDDFVLDNIVIWYKTAESRPVPQQ
jgi:hypothetical protein